MGQQPRTGSGCWGNVAATTASPHSRCTQMGRMHNSSPRMGVREPPAPAPFLSHDAIAITSLSCPTKRVCKTWSAVCRASLWTERVFLLPLGDFRPWAVTVMEPGPQFRERVLDAGTRPQEAGSAARRRREEPGFRRQPFPSSSSFSLI